MLLAVFILQYISTSNRTNEDTQETLDASGLQEAPGESAEAPEKEERSLPNVQDELDDVLGTVRGSHSVLLQDADTGEELASSQPEETFFTASIYKLYVAYLALEDIQSGLYDANEPYNQGRTRMECVVVMLRDSDSPCPEQMWQEQGRDVGTERLRELGLTGTDLVAITTTARDANALLSRLYNQSDLNDQYTTVILDSLKDFPEREFRQGLPSAFDGTRDVVIYDKPGIYDEGWMDAAIITLPDGKSVILSIFSDSAYYQEVRTIADAVVAPLL